MNRRGLTMIELLLALALLAAVISAAASWTRAAADMSVAIKPTHREGIVESALTRIAEDLLTGDFDTREVQSRDDARLKQRVRVVGSAGVGDGHSGETLEIDLRRGTTHIYRLEGAADVQSHLVRVERYPSESHTRTLLHDVTRFHCAIDEEERQLIVTIELAWQQRGDAAHREARAVTRRYSL